MSEPDTKSSSTIDFKASSVPNKTKTAENIFSFEKLKSMLNPSEKCSISSKENKILMPLKNDETSSGFFGKKNQKIQFCEINEL